MMDLHWFWRVALAWTSIALLTAALIAVARHRIRKAHRKPLETIQPTRGSDVPEVVVPKHDTMPAGPASKGVEFERAWLRRQIAAAYTLEAEAWPGRRDGISERIEELKAELQALNAKATCGPVNVDADGRETT